MKSDSVNLLFVLQMLVLIPHSTLLTAVELIGDLTRSCWLPVCYLKHLSLSENWHRFLYSCLLTNREGHHSECLSESLFFYSVQWKVEVVVRQGEQICRGFKIWMLNLWNTLYCFSIMCADHLLCLLLFLSSDSSPTRTLTQYVSSDVTQYEAEQSAEVKEGRTVETTLGLITRHACLSNSSGFPQNNNSWTLLV